MSGYLEVKNPFKNLGLNPFKSWKRQWCILRPSPTNLCCGSLAIYCSEAGAAAGTIELPSGCVVKRAKSRTRPHAFAVFTMEEPRKPRVLLAAATLQEAQIWMDKITTILNGEKLLCTDTLLKDSYSVSILPTALSRKCGLGADGVITLSVNGVLLSQTLKLGMFVAWKHVTAVKLITDNDKNKSCLVNIDSEYSSGGGELTLSSPLATDLMRALQQAIETHNSAAISCKKLSKSESDLQNLKGSENGEHRRNSWLCRPSDVSLDDIDLIMSKESNRIPCGQLSRSSARTLLHAAPSAVSIDDSMSDRRSLLSIESGVYEEIPEVEYCAMSRLCAPTASLPPAQTSASAPEPTYESVGECGAGRPHLHLHPPPLPPRLPFGTLKLGDSWNSRMNKDTTDRDVTRHSSLGSLPRCCSVGSASSQDYTKTRTLPKPDKSKQTLSLFRKRLKSDSRINTSPKYETKENKTVENKKKKFDFQPTRDIFKNFKVGKKKNLKNGNIAKVGETKSCEFLDETEHVSTCRCSKSVECLEENEYADDYVADLSIDFSDGPVEALSLPQEIVDFIIRGREQMNKIRLKGPPISECDYMPMSPIIPTPPIEHHYMVMSPKTNLA